MPRTRLAGMNSAGLTLSWYLLAIAALLSLQSRLNQSVLDGLGLMYITKGVSGTLQILSGLGTICALYSFGTLWAASAAVLLVAALQFLVFRAILFRCAKGHLRRTGSSPHREVLRKLWKVAIPMGIVTSSAYCVSSIQVPLLGAILGPAAVVPYYLAQRIGQTVVMGVMQLSHPQLPMFTAECSRRQWPAARRRMQNTITAVMAGAFAGCLLYFLASPTLVSLWTRSGTYVSPIRSRPNVTGVRRAVIRLDLGSVRSRGGLQSIHVAYPDTWRIEHRGKRIVVLLAWYFGTAHCRPPLRLVTHMTGPPCTAASNCGNTLKYAETEPDRAEETVGNFSRGEQAVALSRETR